MTNIWLPKGVVAALNASQPGDKTGTQNTHGGDGPSTTMVQPASPLASSPAPPLAVRVSSKNYTPDSSNASGRVASARVP